MKYTTLQNISPDQGMKALDPEQLTSGDCNCAQHERWRGGCWYENTDIVNVNSLGRVSGTGSIN